MPRCPLLIDKTIVRSMKNDATRNHSPEVTYIQHCESTNLTSSCVSPPALDPYPIVFRVHRTYLHRLVVETTTQGRLEPETKASDKIFLYCFRIDRRHSAIALQLPSNEFITRNIYPVCQR
jgi:hypothetical protein